jgi:hypothetical protein
MICCTLLGSQPFFFRFLNLLLEHSFMICCTLLGSQPFFFRFLNLLLEHSFMICCTLLGSQPFFFRFLRFIARAFLHDMLHSPRLSAFLLLPLSFNASKTFCRYSYNQSLTYALPFYFFLILSPIINCLNLITIHFIQKHK